MNFRDKLSRISQNNINTENKNMKENIEKSSNFLKFNDSQYQNDGVSHLVFDLTNKSSVESFDTYQKLPKEEKHILDLTQITNNQPQPSEFVIPQMTERNSQDMFLDELLSKMPTSQEDIDTLFKDNENSTSNNPLEQKAPLVFKSGKLDEQKKKSRNDIINEYINNNINFWYKMNLLYIRPTNPDPNIKYETLKRIHDVERVDFSLLRKKNFKLYKAIEDRLNELKVKYNNLIDEIKKTDIFKDHINRDNVRLEDIDIETLKHVLVSKVDVKIKNFLKHYNPYNCYIDKDGNIQQEGKDLLSLRADFEIDVIYDVLGESAIFPFLKNVGISEIMVIGPYKVYIELEGRLIKTKVAFVNDDPLKRYAREVASKIDRPLDSVNLSVDARLPDGSRFHGILQPVARFGTTLTIRKFSDEKLTLLDLISKESLTESMAQMIKCSVASRLNVIVAGGTGSGKTTMLNICSNYIGEYERTITVEDSAELQLIQDHVVSLETKEAKEGTRARTYSIRDLVKECLRMRPDRILCGECRGGEAWDMLVAMNTGHEGSMTTIHSNNPIDTIKRVANMVAQVAGDGVPMRVIYEQIASSVDLIVYQARLFDGSRRTTYISEVRNYNIVTQSVEVVDIYKFIITGEDEEGRIVGKYEWTGNLPSNEIVYKVHSKGHLFPPEIEEALKVRTEKRKAEHTLEDEQRIIDTLELDAAFKERLKLSVEVLRKKESENELEIIEQLDVPLSLKKRMRKLLEDDIKRSLQTDTIGV